MTASFNDKFDNPRLARQLAALTTSLEAVKKRMSCAFRGSNCQFTNCKLVAERVNNFVCLINYCYCAAIAQSVQRLATGWTVRGSNPGGGEVFRTHLDMPWGPPSLLYDGYRVSFPEVMRPGRGVEHLPHLAPRLNKE